MIVLKNYKRVIIALLSFIVVGILLFTSSVAMAAIVVIGNSKLHVNHLTKTQVENFYLGKPVDLKTGEVLQPYDHVENSAIYRKFYKHLMGWGPSQVSNYWSSLIFDGEASPPPTLTNDSKAITTVENNLHAISYIESQDLPKKRGHVKVLYQVDQKNFKYLLGYYNVNPQLKDDTKPSYRSDKKSPADHSKRINTKLQHEIDTINQSLNSYHVKKSSTEQASSSDIQEEVDNINKSLDAYREKKNSARASQQPKHSQRGKNLWPVLTAHFDLGDYSDQPDVRDEIYFLTHHKSTLREMLNNAVPYLYYVYQQTQQRDMPAEFALLPMIESDYNPFAYSRAGAVGLWQLMQGTASSLGIETSWWYDGRRDTLVSTQVALNYLSHLHDTLHNWLLTAAAYNAGIGTVQTAEEYNERYNLSTDFWNLRLPRETKWYVPELLALAEIIKNPAEYGIKLPYIPNAPYFSATNVNSQISLQKAAKLAGISPRLMHLLNPGIRRFATSPHSNHILLIPISRKQAFDKKLAKLDGKPHLSWHYHEVQRGETLTQIAKNYHTTISYLKKINHLKHNHLEAYQGILVPLHLHRTYSAPTAVVASKKDSKNSNNLKQLLHKIYS